MESTLNDNIKSHSQLIKGIPREDYFKFWYKNNKDTFLEKLLTPVTCECGFECGKNNLKRHQKTKLHLKKLSKKEIV